MNNILDYLDWRGDVPVSFDGFNEVDNLLLAELSFLDLDGIVPGVGEHGSIALSDAAERYFARSGGATVDMGLLLTDKIPRLFARMARTARFAGMRLALFTERMDEQREQQFGALCIEVGDGTVYVSFRGTDDTLLGWKEDLNMSFLDAIPSQESAAAYLSLAARQYGQHRLRVGGHSKGGNLAVYSAVYADPAVQDRIERIYSNDGPGFVRDITNSAEYRRVAKRILKLMPQSSVVGTLLEGEHTSQIVHSSAAGVLQHDGFSWEVRGTQFVHLEKPSAEGKWIEQTFDAWAEELSTPQREAFANALYEVLTSTGARTLSDLSAEKLKSAMGILKSYKNLDRETRKALSGAIGLLLRIGAQGAMQDTRREGEREIAELRARLEAQMRKQHE